MKRSSSSAQALSDLFGIFAPEVVSGFGKRQDRRAKQKRVGEEVEAFEFCRCTRVRQVPDQHGPVVTGPGDAKSVFGITQVPLTHCSREEWIS
jgi:hypothetical protein